MPSHSADTIDVGPTTTTRDPTNNFGIAPKQLSAIHDALNTYFGYQEFRPGQLELLAPLVSEDSLGKPSSRRKDCLGVMATGCGKSLVFQLPALLSGKPSICISPLISLMEDQVIKLNESVGKTRAQLGKSKGNEVAIFFGGSNAGNAASVQLAEKVKRSNEILFIYMSPEKVKCGGLELIREIAKERGGLACLAIDEAHCVSEWGSDFRPDYLNLGLLRKDAVLGKFDIPIVALTATAPGKVQQDIVSSLHLNPANLVHYQGDLFRRNLTFEVRTLRPSAGIYSSLDFVLEELKSLSASNTVAMSLPPTIIYANSKAEVDAIQAYLQQHLEAHSCGSRKVNVLKYHAGMSLSQRNDAHIAFLTGRASIVVATVAFGMGIDKPDIRRVIHFGPPRTVESYYQQAGRAGRDGNASVCTMVPGSKTLAQQFIDFQTSEFYKPKGANGIVNEAQWKALNASTQALRQFCESCSECRQTSLIRYLTTGLHSLELPRFPAWCQCDMCVASRRTGENGDPILQKQDFRYECKLVLGAAKTWARKSKGLILDLLMGSTAKKITEARGLLNLNVQAHKQLYGAWKGTAHANWSQSNSTQPGSSTASNLNASDSMNLLKSNKREVCQEFLELLSNSRTSDLNQVWIEKTVESFARTGSAFTVGYETVHLTQRGQAVLNLLSNNYNDPETERLCTFEAGPHLVKAFRLQEEKRQQRLKEVRECIKDTSKIPKKELERGEGATLEEELKWARYLAGNSFQAEIKPAGSTSSESDSSPMIPNPLGPQRKTAAENLLTLLDQWRLNQATTLKMAFATVLPELLLKRIAYAATHGKVDAQLLWHIGVRIGDAGGLEFEIAKWREEEWNGLWAMSTGASSSSTQPGPNSNETDSNISKPSVDVNVPLPIPQSWRARRFNVPSTKASGKLTETVKESATLFAQGHSVETVGVMRAKQIAPSTVQGHLMTAFMHGFPREKLEEASYMERLARLCFGISLHEWDVITDAFRVANIDWSDAQPPMKPVVEHLGGDTSWYTKLRNYRSLRLLEYPIDEARTMVMSSTTLTTGDNRQQGRHQNVEAVTAAESSFRCAGVIQQQGSSALPNNDSNNDSGEPPLKKRRRPQFSS